MIKAVLFDFDGTLTAPGHIDFDGIRKQIGATPGMPILEYIDSLEDPSVVERAVAILEKAEADAAAVSLPNKGAEDLVEYLLGIPVKTGIITRNSMSSLGLALSNFHKTKARDFDVILTREHVTEQKPDPECVLKASEMLGVLPGEILVVGDYVFDVEAGRRAGAVTVYLNNGNEVLSDIQADHIISELSEVKNLV